MILTVSSTCLLIPVNTQLHPSVRYVLRPPGSKLEIGSRLFAMSNSMIEPREGSSLRVDCREASGVSLETFRFLELEVRMHDQIQGRIPTICVQN
jgi:hypothetical protein